MLIVQTEEKCAGDLHQTLSTVQEVAFLACQTPVGLYRFTILHFFNFQSAFFCHKHEAFVTFPARQFIIFKDLILAIPNRRNAFLKIRFRIFEQHKIFSTGLARIGIRKMCGTVWSLDQSGDADKDLRFLDTVRSHDEFVWVGAFHTRRETVFENHDSAML